MRIILEFTLHMNHEGARIAQESSSPPLLINHHHW